jgi:hypothetical protein
MGSGGGEGRTTKSKHGPSPELAKGGREEGRTEGRKGGREEGREEGREGGRKGRKGLE